MDFKQLTRDSVQESDGKATTPRCNLKVLADNISAAWKEIDAAQHASNDCSGANDLGFWILRQRLLAAKDKILDASGFVAALAARYSTHTRYWKEIGQVSDEQRMIDAAHNAERTQHKLADWHDQQEDQRSGYDEHEESRKDNEDGGA